MPRAAVVRADAGVVAGVVARVNVRVDVGVPLVGRGRSVFCWSGAVAVGVSGAVGRGTRDRAWEAG
ncbi:hypothetical protein [Streptomyces lancefieldiae]|uniref:Uncharacterized protein n=1 Tax=Streptomyces lancefieldiae TaxID=3075520 RepID=A0ABU3AXE4_9ACTN|nr:hypothetical protein [Streptomyces sp. DSM 40712]MDT0614858.1 hypothetical protein [Streptomyces sp. DSM 40712]